MTVYSVPNLFVYTVLLLPGHTGSGPPDPTLDEPDPVFEELDPVLDVEVVVGDVDDVDDVEEVEDLVDDVVLVEEPD